ncbi:alpha-mannosidase [Niastella koreensis]|uniref:Alpha-1,2-mannosidase n=2 Tax=Niastella koreensis TaxID=354356 RepID=G8TEK7_NIAKG|nr:GH92 family glycosyl hydrolase [Niastella koreensis]AEV99429.1 alpha-1,2-mannosidase [Niastella koreensis GR20-10]OQP50029.1 alpha-mannosidase [Niastella koreensis]
MKRTGLFLLLQVAALNSWAQNVPISTGITVPESNTRYVDPRIGNVGALLQPTRPTIQQPNQMIRMNPQRADYLDDQIASFPLNIVSHRLGEVFAIKPTIKQPVLGSWKEPMLYDHDLEVTRPWYYSTWLVNDNITVEFTPGKKAGYYRFTFPANSAKNILFAPYNNGESEFNFTATREFTGMETYHGNIKVYVYGQFNTDVTAGTVKAGALQTANSVGGKDIKAWAGFPASAPAVIEFKYAISYVSAAQAKKNYDNELANTGFEQLQQLGETAWNKVMGQIQVTGGTEAQKRSFYTALYRCYERLVDITEDGKYFSGFDNKVHTIENNRPFYVDDWTWDTYLAQHPLRTVLNPAMEEDILNSYVTMYRQGGWMPTFPVLFGDHACMNGFHSSVMILDGYRKGLRHFDVLEAYAGMKKNATQATMIPWRNGPSTPLDDYYRTNGYFPALQKGAVETNTSVHPFEKRQAVAVTLAGSYDDWAVGELAKELGKNDDYKTFNAHAVNYKNLWHPGRGMFLPKDDKGHWVEIDPKFDGGMGGRDYYDENNGWTYLWQVQQDIKGLVSLMNGKAGFEQKLDQLFHEGLDRSKYEFWAKFPDATALVGQYSMGNEPGFHIPYLYNFTNSPWKTQKRIRFLLDVWFKDNIFGIPGDEDGGGMSAFVVFSAMGFYPITPGNPVYTIGSPLFEKISIDLPGGKQFHVNAKNCSVINKYIQSAKFNGQPLNIPWFTHEQLMAGGTLELEMGPKPNKEWGIDH